MPRELAFIPPYPIDPDERANRVAMLAAIEGWCPASTRAAYRRWFIDKQDPGRPGVLREILAGLDRDAERCLREADPAAMRDAYVAQTARARDVGVFGSPNFGSGGELFWGDDRLDDALAWVQAHQRESAGR